jgi:hypothetical protein
VSGPGRSLGVLVDGVAMAPEEARAFWERFSAHMETNKGDLAGFARAEGFASVHPSLGPAGPVLLASRSSAQKPYTSVGKSDGASARSAARSTPEGAGAYGGSSDHQGSSRDPSRGGGKHRKHSKKRR